MSKIAMVTGLLLIAIGLSGYFLTPTTTVNAEGVTVEKARSITAMIPMFFGIPILLCGIWGTMNPKANHHAMHGAVLVATIGALAAIGRSIVSLLKLVNADGEFNQRAFVFLVLMGVVCIMFVIACVKSFITAGKARRAAEQA